jgi:hypothetical protein
LRQATTRKLSTPGGQAATHQPQPVQRGVWMWGSFGGMGSSMEKDPIVHPNPFTGSTANPFAFCHSSPHGQAAQPTTAR